MSTTQAGKSISAGHAESMSAEESEAWLTAEANKRGKRLGQYLDWQRHGGHVDMWADVPPHDPDLDARVLTVECQMGTPWSAQAAVVPDRQHLAIPWVRQAGKWVRADMPPPVPQPELYLWVRRREDDLYVPLAESECTDQAYDLWQTWTVDQQGATAEQEANEIGKDVAEQVDVRSAAAYFDKLAKGSWHALSYSTWGLPAMGVSRVSCGQWIAGELAESWYPEGCYGPEQAVTPSEKAQRKKHIKKDEHGEPVLDKDGNVVTMGVVRRHKVTCKSIQCGPCVEDAARRMARRATERAEAYIMWSRGALGESHQARQYTHFVVSPNKDQYENLKDLKALAAYEKKVLKELKRIGMKAAVMVFHPFRFTKGLGRPYWSPHWHFLFIGWTEPDDIKQAYRNLGAVCRAIGVTASSEDAYAILYYILSHAGVRVDGVRKHVVRYVAGLGNRKFSTAVLLKASSELKDVCRDKAEEIVSGDIVRKPGHEESRTVVDAVDVQRHVLGADRMVDTGRYGKVLHISGGRRDMAHALAAALEGVPPTAPPDGGGAAAAAPAGAPSAGTGRAANLAIPPSKAGGVAAGAEGEGEWADGGGAADSTEHLPERAPNEWEIVQVRIQYHLERVSLVRDAVTGEPIVDKYDAGVARWSYVIDPGGTQLCPVCARKLRPLVLSDLSKVQKPDVPRRAAVDMSEGMDQEAKKEAEQAEWLRIDPAEWHYRTRDDVMSGTPYYNDSLDVIQYDEGTRQRNPHYRQQDEQAQVIQNKAIKEAIIRKLKGEARNRARAERKEWTKEEVWEYVRAHMPEYEHLWARYAQATL